MSIRSVNKQIRTALADQKITKCEADDIIATAQKGPLTTGEAKTIANTFQRLDNPPMFSLPPPGVQVDWPTFDSMTPEARKSFTNFFVESRIPAGDNKGTIRDAIKSSVKDQGLTADKLLDCAPNTKHLHQVYLNDGIGLMNSAFVDTAKQEFYIETASRGAELGPQYYGPFDLSIAVKTSVDEMFATIKNEMQHFDRSSKLDASPSDDGHVKFTVSDRRPVDGPLTVAYVNPETEEYYVAVQSARMIIGGEDIGPEYFGPFDVDHKFLQHTQPTDPIVLPDPAVNPNAITATTISDIRSSWESQADNASFRLNGGLPMGISFDRIKLSNDADDGIADGYQYTALVPSGSQNPSAPAGSGPNPNTVNYYFVERSGGFAGLTSLAGPLDK